jgi:hypothetical protein
MKWKVWSRLRNKRVEKSIAVFHLRSIALREFGKYYRPVHFDRLKTMELEGEQLEVVMCYYCDDPAEHKDHVYPVSALTRDILKRRVNHKFLRKLPLYIVPACARCNMLLRDKVFKSLAERQRYMKKRLKIGY